MGDEGSLRDSIYYIVTVVTSSRGARNNKSDSHLDDCVCACVREVSVRVCERECVCSFVCVCILIRS